MTRRAATTEATQVPLPRLLTVRELADLLQVPPKTIYTWRYKGVGPPAIPLGRYLRFRADDVAAWLQSRAEAADRPEQGGIWPPKQVIGARYGRGRSR